MNEESKNSYVFVLGRESVIALAELKSVLNRFGFVFDIYKITANLVFAKIEKFDENEAKELMTALAGTVKIFQIVGRTEKDIASQIASIFRDRKSGIDGKINFGISYYGQGFSRQNINSIALSAKKKLKGSFSLRYVESRDSLDLSTILTLKNNLLTKGIEFGLFENQIGVLAALNDPEEWNKRDYGKPAFDKYSGMVPPKLARMMVNLAVENNPSETLVIDPFCGSGNVSMEAMMLGYNVVCSDISEKAVGDTNTNLEWAKDEYNLSADFTVSQADATKFDFTKLVGAEDLVVVTEPYLGEPKKIKPTKKAAAGEYLKIKELYLGFLKNIKQLNNKKSIICIIFPLIDTCDMGSFSLYNESVDEIKKLGYTQACKSFVYGRDYQVVKREIVLLRQEK